MVKVAEVPHADVAAKQGGAIPDLSGDIRHLIPKLNLRNYWYPAIAARRIPKRHPVQVRMVGEDLCFFRGAQGQAVAIRDICPHRGARPSEGTCHWKGTVTCPYHGWTFDEHGKNVAVLSEGPDSKICGKPGTEAYVYPTRELKGIVFAWIGDTEPAPIEEDVPEEFFDPKAYILYNDHIYWTTNWCVALENYFDAHVSYLHRDDTQTLLGRPDFTPRATAESVMPRFAGNGFVYYAGREQSSPPQDIYPNGWKWPKHRFRRWWAWFFTPFFSLTRVPAPRPKDSDWWGRDLHLPGLVRIGHINEPGQGRFRFGGGGFVGMVTRQVIAVEPDFTHVWYFHHTQPDNWVQKMWHKLLYNVFYRWAFEYNFSPQDFSVMPNQRWDWHEMFSPTDLGVVQWRKLVVTKRFGGRSAKFGDQKASAAATHAQPASAGD